MDFCLSIVGKLKLPVCPGEGPLSDIRQATIKMFFGVVDHQSTVISIFFVAGFLQLSSFVGRTNRASQYLRSSRIEVTYPSGLITSRSRELRVSTNVFLKRGPMDSNRDMEGSENRAG